MRKGRELADSLDPASEYFRVVVILVSETSRKESFTSTLWS